MAVKSTVPPRSDPPGQEPPPTVVIKATSGLSALQLGAVWEYRELLYFMVWRDVKVRYKQTALGVIWVILQPLLSTLVFTVIFGVLLNVPSNGLPYPIFAYAGLLPWQYFASSLTRTSTNLVDNANLITKVYFPRLTIPLSGVLASLVMLAVLMLIYRIPLTPAVLLLPLFLLLAMITALGFGLWLSALNVRYRDIKQLIPFIVQLWIYLTPVIWPVKPETGTGMRWRAISSPASSMPAQTRAALIAIR